MKILIFTILFSTINYSLFGADIIFSASVKPQYVQYLTKDINNLNKLKFLELDSNRPLEVFGINEFNSSTLSNWLLSRAHFIVPENAISNLNIRLRRMVYIDQKDILYPNADLIPYSSDLGNALKETSDEKLTVMSNIGSEIYQNGKNQKSLLSMKIPRGIFKEALKIKITSPRVGIIQIGEGLFSPQTRINNINDEAFSNSIFRLTALFHESRHSDGNGESLAFGHVECPKNHAYAGLLACDENLNGPYTIGAMVMTEMLKACGDNCSEMERETLKLVILDNSNRILKRTHKGEISKDWDASPESL